MKAIEQLEALAHEAIVATSNYQKDDNGYCVAQTAYFKGYEAGSRDMEDAITRWIDPIAMLPEYWRHVYAGQMMAAAFPVLVSADWQAKDEYANIPAETLIARQAIDLTNALLEELEKTEKKL